MQFKDNKAIYLQIADMICDAIVSGRYRAGERIPSVREYAVEMQVNANTIARSFEYLQSENIIFNKRGIGYFVDKTASEKIFAHRRELFENEELPHIFSKMQELKISIDEISKRYSEFCNREENIE